MPHRIDLAGRYRDSRRRRPRWGHGLLRSNRAHSLLSVLARFQMVCAPWTRSSYHLAWRWLYFAGRSMADGTDLMVHGSRWSIGLLWAGLTYFIEQRRVEVAGGEAEPVDYFRPGSAILCPPGYAMQEFELWLNDDQTTYAGLRSVRCVSLEVDTNGQRSTHTVAAASGAFHDGYEWDIPAGADGIRSTTIPFSLDQWIGNPSAETAAHRFLCDDGYAIRGVTWMHTNQDALSDVGYTCIDLP